MRVFIVPLIGFEAVYVELVKKLAHLILNIFHKWYSKVFVNSNTWWRGEDDDWVHPP